MSKYPKANTGRETSGKDEAGKITTACAACGSTSQLARHLHFLDFQDTKDLAQHLRAENPAGEDTGANAATIGWRNSLWQLYGGLADEKGKSLSVAQAWIDAARAAKAKHDEKCEACKTFGLPAGWEIKAPRGWSAQSARLDSLSTAIRRMDLVAKHSEAARGDHPLTRFFREVADRYREQLAKDRQPKPEPIGRLLGATREISDGWEGWSE